MLRHQMWDPFLLSTWRHEWFSSLFRGRNATKSDYHTIPYRMIPLLTITITNYYHAIYQKWFQDQLLWKGLARLCCPACRSLGPTTKRISRWAVMDDVCIFGLRRLFFSMAHVPICYERGRQTLFGLWKLSSDLWLFDVGFAGIKLHVQMLHFARSQMFPRIFPHLSVPKMSQPGGWCEFPMPGFVQPRVPQRSVWSNGETMRTMMASDFLGFSMRPTTFF